MKTQAQVTNGFFFKLWNNRILVYENLFTFESYGMLCCFANVRRVIKANGLVKRERLVIVIFN